MRILHTSDWHLGKKLKDHDRSEEFRKFLAWLECVIESEKPDALIVSGDIFDTRIPSVEAQEMYYKFLANVAGESCRNVIITAGNHDSAPFIDAPAGIMGRCNVHVIGRPCEGEIITLKDENDRPEAIVCAVPFLHDRDVRTVKDDDTPSDIEREIRAGIMSHYAEKFRQARELRGDMNIPIIATGHLFLEAGRTQAGEGEHALYVGTAIKVGTDIFPEDIAYTALGHLHSPQRVGRDNIRYSGSPIALSFGEWGTDKTVSIVDFDGRNFAGVREIKIPVWQKMERISGDMAEIEQKLRGLAGDESVWAEVTYTGTEAPGNLQDKLTEILKVYPNVEVLNVIDEVRYQTDDTGDDKFRGLTLEDIEPVKMLQSIMEARKIPENMRGKLEGLYRKILNEILTGDKSR